jgi:hypothetical protein
VSESAASPSKDPLASSVPDGAASLESILCTEELQSRPSRPPNYEKENHALRALVSALATHQARSFRHWLKQSRILLRVTLLALVC